MNSKLVKSRLTDLNLSVQDFCKQIGISRTTFYKCMEDDVNPSTKILRAISTALNIPLEDLATDSTETRETISALREEIIRQNRIIDELLDKIESYKSTLKQS